MSVKSIAVDYRYTRDDLMALLNLAHAEDIEEGGWYDAHPTAINIYIHPWAVEMMQVERTIMGTFYLSWTGANRIWQIDVGEGFSFEDLSRELGALEKRALGRKIHGI